MKIELDLSPEQEATLAKLNTLSNGENTPPLEEFAVSHLLGLIDIKGEKLDREEVVKAAAVLTSVKLDAEDLATVLAIAAKHPTK